MYSIKFVKFNATLLYNNKFRAKSYLNVKLLCYNNIKMRYELSIIIDIYIDMRVVTC